MKICQKCFQIFSSDSWRCCKCGYSPDVNFGFTVFHADKTNIDFNFPEDAHAELSSLEDNSFWFKSRNRLVLWALEKYFPSFNNYLEIGCGTGYVLSAVSQAFPYANICGSEAYMSGILIAKSRAKDVELMLMDARNIPYSDEFDVIGAFDVLEHIREDDIVLNELFRAVSRNGGIIITVPQHPRLWSRQDDYAGHIRRYKIGELTKKIERAGFNVVFKTSFVSLLLPIMYLSRLFTRNIFSNKRKGPELFLPKFINLLFFGIMTLERQIIKLGLSFRVGGSFMIIAKKIK